MTLTEARLCECACVCPRLKMMRWVTGAERPREKECEPKRVRENPKAKFRDIVGVCRNFCKSIYWLRLFGFGLLPYIYISFSSFNSVTVSCVKYSTSWPKQFERRKKQKEYASRVCSSNSNVSKTRTVYVRFQFRIHKTEHQQMLSHADAWM